MASKTLLVAQREYLENVRTKTFWLGIFIVPVLIGASIGIGALLKQFKQVQKYTVVDLADDGLLDRTERAFRKDDFSAVLREMQKQKDAGEIRAEFSELAKLQPAPGEELSGEQQLAVLNWMSKQPPEVMARIEGLSTSRRFDYVGVEELGISTQEPDALLKELNKLVGDSKLFGYFVLGKDPLQSLADFTYVSNNQADDSLQRSYQNTLTELIQQDRIKAEGIKRSVAERIQERVRFKKERVDETGEVANVEDKDITNQWAPMGFVYFLWLAIFSIANLLLTNTIEEKSNRIIEVLLSSVSPNQLMNGKIFGIAFTGLTIIGTWVAFALLAAWFAPMLLGEGGGFLKSVLPALGNISYLTSFVLYFLGGFLLYAAVLVAIGSVCNTLKEAQNLMQPVMMILMVPLIAMVFITQEPNGTVAKVMSFIPLFTPFTMMNRAGGPPETWEYIVTSILLVATIWFAFRAAGKVFRVGVLMTGNPPKLKEIFGWLRQS